MIRPFSLSELAVPLSGALSGGDASFSAVSTDSRSLNAGALFVALKGEHFDGHRFVREAAEAGACAALVSEALDVALPMLRVHDTRRALGRLGSLNRKAYRGPLVGVTGSCGKTSVKNMLGAVLSGVGETLATAGNFNNEIGVPLTLLELNGSHRFAVVEMGAGAPGDIAYLCELAQPDITLLLNALPAHLEFMGSVDGIARTKGEILSALSGEGTAIFPADSEFTPLWRELAGSSRRLEFGFSAGADVTASDIALEASSVRFTLEILGQSAPVTMRVPGRHNVANALAAAAAATAAGLSIETIVAGLASVDSVEGRLRSIPLSGGITLIDDSYNANPGSLKAAIDVLAAHPGRRVLVLGTMAELGERAQELHADAGRYAANRGIDVLWATGMHCQSAVDAFGEGARFFEDRDALTDRLQQFVTAGDVVLIKGSRSAGMDAVVAALAHSPVPGAVEG